MSRLPIIGSDDDVWGDILSDYLSVEHNADGTQKILGISKGGTGAVSASAARTALGTIADTDARLSDTRTPTNGSVTDASISGTLSPTSITGTAITVSIATTKGDLLAASAASTITRLGVGSDGQVLTADSTQATGLKWATGGGGAPTGAASGDLTGTYPAPTLNIRERLDRYVDYVNGNDANDGKTQLRSFKTIQAAYNALVTAAAAYTADSNGRRGVGRIFLAPGDHDIGSSSIALDSRYGVEIIGTRSGHRNHDMHNSASRIVCSSATPTEFVLISHTNTIGMGFVFRDVTFTLDQTVATSISKILYVKTIDHLVVDNCSFNTADNSTNVAVVAIYQEDNPGQSGGGDSAWARIGNCNCADMAFYKAATTDVGGAANFNRFRIHDNVIFYGGTLPMIQFAAAINGGLVDNNNLEGHATGIQIGPLSPGATSTIFINNSGEDNTTGTPNPFYDFVAGVFQMVIIGGSVTTNGPPAANKEFAKFASGASNNIIIGPYDKTGNASQARKITDSSTNGVRILDTNAGLYARYVAAATIGDSNYSKTPDNGAWGISYG